MKKRITVPTILVLLAMSLLLTSCYETVTSYNPPSQANLLVLNQVISPQTKIAVPPFTSAIPDKQLTCRPGQPIVLHPRDSFSGYLHKALVNTLKTNHSYDAHSKIQLVGELTKLDFDAGVFNTGSWKITMRFRGKNNKAFEVADHYDFNVNTQDKRFCQYILEAFPSATQHFIGTLFKNPDFAKLIGGEKTYRY